MSGSKLDPGGRAASTRLRYASASFTFTTGGSRFGMMMARPKWLAVNGSDAFSIAPSRTCRCQSSGLRRVIFNGDPSAYAHHADFQRGRAGEEVFDHVVDLHDAAAADDRDLHAPGALVHHAQHDRLHPRPRDAAVSLADARAPGFDIDLQAEDGIRNRDRVRA